MLSRLRSESPSATAPNTRPIDVARTDPRDYSFQADLVRGEDGSRSGLHSYDDGHRRLYFVSANHGTPETLTSVDQAFLTEDFQAVIVEIEPSRPPDYCDGEGTGSFESCLAVRLAKRHGIEVVYGEYEPRAQVEALIARTHYTLKDYEGFWLIRTMTGNHNRARTFPSFDALFEQLSDEFVEEFQYPRGELLTKEEFQRWYREGNGKPSHFDLNVQYRSIPESEAWSRGGLRTQQLLSETTRVKDVHLGRKIADALSRHQGVLVVYGGAHYSDLRAALAAMMGPPK